MSIRIESTRRRRRHSRRCGSTGRRRTSPSIHGDTLLDTPIHTTHKRDGIVGYQDKRVGVMVVAGTIGVQCG